MKNNQIQYVALMIIPSSIAFFVGHVGNFGFTDHAIFCFLGACVGFALCSILASAELQEHADMLELDIESVARRRTANDIARQLGEEVPFPALERRK